MSQPFQINGREIRLIEYSTERNWSAQLPRREWLCVLLSHDQHCRYLDEVFNKLIFQDVCYVCTIGKQCELAHDLLDEEINYREVEEPAPYLPKHHIMTTWHQELEEGLWFAIYAAHHETVSLRQIVILDMTGGMELPQVKHFLTRFLPS